MAENRKQIKAARAGEPDAIAREAFNRLRRLESLEYLRAEDIILMTKYEEFRGRVWDALQARENPVFQIILALLEENENGENQLKSALDTTSLFKIGSVEGDVPLPSYEQILRSITSQLTPRQAEEILSFQEARLVVYPITNADRYEQAMNYEAWNESESQLTPRMDGLAQQLLNEQSRSGKRITSYRWAIMEESLIVNVPKWDDTRQNFSERIQTFDTHYYGTGIQRPDMRSTALMIMNKLRTGTWSNDLDEKTQNNWQYTLLQDTNTQRSHLGFSDWYPGIDIIIGMYNIRNSSYRARLRPAVIGKVEL